MRAVDDLRSDEGGELHQLVEVSAQSMDGGRGLALIPGAIDPARHDVGPLHLARLAGLVHREGTDQVAVKA